MELSINIILEGTFTSLGIIAALFVVYILITRLSAFIASITKSAYINRKTEIYRNKIIDSKLNDDNESTASIISKITNDLNIIKTDYHDNLIEIISLTASFLLSSYLIIKIDPIIIFVLYGLVAIMFLFPLLFKKFLEQKNLQISLLNNNYINKLKDILDGLPVIKHYDCTIPFYNQAATHNKNVSNSTIKLDIINQLFEEISHFL